MTAGYRALREGAALLDLAGRGVIRATGEDRHRLLHAMTTNHIESLQPGQWRYAFFLNAQGRILADVNVLCREDDFLLDTEPETRQLVYEHLDKFIIADDVELEDISDQTAVVAVEGPRAAEICQAAGAETPWTISSTGEPGLRFFVPAGDKTELIAKLEAAGATAATHDDVHIVRLEHAHARYGEDLSQSHIPHEARLLGAVHFNKGCYLGQEIVERVRSRGRPNRLLTHLLLDAAQPPAPGTKIMAGDKEAGVVTSSAFSPSEGKVIVLGYVWRDWADAGKEVTISGAPATVTNRLAEQPAA